MSHLPSTPPHPGSAPPILHLLTQMPSWACGTQGRWWALLSEKPPFLSPPRVGPFSSSGLCVTFSTFQGPLDSITGWRLLTLVTCVTAVVQPLRRKRTLSAPQTLHFQKQHESLPSAINGLSWASEFQWDIVCVKLSQFALLYFAARGRSAYMKPISMEAWDYKWVSSLPNISGPREVVKSVGTSLALWRSHPNWGKIPL